MKIALSRYYNYTQFVSDVDVVAQVIQGKCERHGLGSEKFDKSAHICAKLSSKIGCVPGCRAGSPY